MRIASLSPAVTEILFALGAEGDIVCSDQFSDYPEKAGELAHLKDHQRINPASLAEYKPEVVFTSTLVQEKLAAELKKADIPTSPRDAGLRGAGWSVIHQDPRTIEQIYETIRAIGMIVEREKEASALILKMQQGFNDVSKKSRLMPKKLRVYIEEWHNPPMVSGNWVPEIIRLAGGQGLPLEPQAPSREVSLEEIQKFDPDVIVLSICGAGRFAEKSLLTNRSGWKDLRAVAENHLFVIDDSLLNRPGPRLTEGAHRLYSWMFQCLH